MNSSSRPLPEQPALIILFADAAVGQGAAVSSSSGREVVLLELVRKIRIHFRRRRAGGLALCVTLAENQLLIHQAFGHGPPQVG